MKQLMLTLLSLLFVTGCISTNDKTFEYMSSVTEPSVLKTAENESEIHFRIYSPKLVKGEKYPVCIYLHDEGETGNDNASQMTNGFDRIVKFISDNDAGVIAIAPQCPKGSQWKDKEMIEVVHDLIYSLLDKDEVDSNRIYLTGYGMGGEGVWNFALEYPLCASAFAPVCGGCPISKTTSVEKVPVDLGEVSIWAVHYLDDRVRTPDLSKKILRLVWVQSVALARMTEFPSGGHTPEIYSNENFMWWLFSTRRDVMPYFQ